MACIEGTHTLNIAVKIEDTILEQEHDKTNYK